MIENPLIYEIHKKCLGGGDRKGQLRGLEGKGLDYV